MKLYADFDTIDQAENCVRQLKHRCDGIGAVRLRFRDGLENKGGKDGGSLIAAAAAAAPFPAYGGTVNAFATQGGITGAPYAAGFLAGESLDGEGAGGADGPAGRSYCHMELLLDNSAARGVEQIIISHGGRRIRRVRA